MTIILVLSLQAFSNECQPCYDVADQEQATIDAAWASDVTRLTATSPAVRRTFANGLSALLVSN
jgi:hypothetical protein